MDEEERREVSLCFGSYANPTDIPKDSGPPMKPLLNGAVFTFVSFQSKNNNVARAYSL